MVHTKRVLLAKEWLLKLETREIWRARRVPLIEEAPKFALTPDASPLGVGAVLSAVDYQTEQLTALAAIKGKVKKNVAASLGIPYNDPASQAVLEAWTVLLAVKYGAFAQGRLDGSLGSFKETVIAHTNTLNWVGAELSLTLAHRAPLGGHTAWFRWDPGPGHE